MLVSRQNTLLETGFNIRQNSNTVLDSRMIWWRDWI